MDGNGWMPIESAPKDGTHVLIWCDGLTRPSVGWFDHAISCGAEPGWWSESGQTIPAFRESVERDGEPGHEAFNQPTHWQPLPSPPEK